MNPTDRKNTPRLTVHQKRVLAALLALEQAHGWQWWTRDAIGHVVDAGGFHGVIQIKTIAILKEAGLVMTERKSWPAEVAALIRCQCACHRWGLTDSGKTLAATFAISWPPQAVKRVEDCRSSDHSTWWRDEDEKPPGWDDDDDDGDDDRPPVGSPSAPELLTV